MRGIYLTLIVGGLTFAAAPAVAQTMDSPSAQVQQANTASEAYRDGFLHGQTDARNGVRNDQPTARWASEGERNSYRDGYQAGYMQSSPASTSSNPATSADAMNYNQPGPAQYGYNDGLANGRKDKTKGDKFKPTDGDMYKHADHGWAAEFGDKDHYKQVYRQAYAKGYEEGYNGGVPR